VKVVITGSREFLDPLEATRVIMWRIAALAPDDLLIHGAARGADRFAGQAAKAKGIQVLPVPAQWDVHTDGCGCKNRAWCLDAGKRRNLEMLDMQPDLVIAFWNGSSGGTRHTIENAEARGIPVEVVKLK
jgi:hypothetical protein